MKFYTISANVMDSGNTKKNSLLNLLLPVAEMLQRLEARPALRHTWI